MSSITRMACGRMISRNVLIPASSASVGCFVRVVGGHDQTIYLLTTGHLFLADNLAAPVVIYSDLVDGMNSGAVAIANPAIIVRKNFNGYGVDVAMVPLLPNLWDRQYWNNYVWQTGNIRGIKDLRNITINFSSPISVTKYGATTGVTHGTVNGVTSINEGQGLVLNNLISIKSSSDNLSADGFAAEGDSGAPVLDSEGMLVGIIFSRPAGKGTGAYACHIVPVLNSLGVELAALGDA